MKALNMKLLLIAILFTWMSLSVELDPNYTFASFLEQFQKKYEERDMAAHEEAFKKNYA